VTENIDIENIETVAFHLQSPGMDTRPTDPPVFSSDANNRTSVCQKLTSFQTRKMQNNGGYSIAAISDVLSIQLLSLNCPRSSALASLSARIHRASLSCKGAEPITRTLYRATPAAWADHGDHYIARLQSLINQQWRQKS
jgi:hypothetical protein